MNEQSLDRVNAFLAAAAARVRPGEVLDATPAEIGRELEFPDALSTARAVRALIARRRLEPADGSYRLLDARPVDPGEKEAIGRRPRKRRDAGRGGTHGTRTAGDSGRRAGVGGPAYSDLGRATVDRLIDLGREVATLRANLRSAREEARESREARLDAERRAESLVARVHDLEQRAEMAESNLRTLLASARGGTQKDARVPDSEMEAILGVLKGGDDDVETEDRANDGQQGSDGAESLVGEDDVAEAAGAVGVFSRPASAPEG
jgi:hypothetical protein